MRYDEGAISYDTSLKPKKRKPTNCFKNCIGNFSRIEKNAVVPELELLIKNYDDS